jgi:hypothetical protein
MVRRSALSAAELTKLLDVSLHGVISVLALALLMLTDG